jgi:hypothetical protein
MKNFVFLSLLFLVACSSQKRLTAEINKLNGVDFENSKTNKAIFIKAKRNELLRNLYVNESNIINDKVIIEKYDLLYDPFQVFFCVESKGVIQYYRSVGINDPLSLFNLDSDIYTQAFFDKVLKFYQEKKFTEIRQLGQEESRAISDPSLLYIYTIGQKHQKIKAITNFLKFDDFGLSSQELREYN